MDLRDYKITVGELLKNKQAAALLEKEFPELAKSPMLRFASGMPLAKVLQMAEKRISKEKIDSVLRALKQI